MNASLRTLTPELPDTSRSSPDLAGEIFRLGHWFHNINLHGLQTAPDHFLGDFPNYKWEQIGPALPADLCGASVLDVGCNAGFYSIAMKQRNAGRVLGVDVDEHCLRQARFAAKTLGMDIQYEKRSVYQVDEIAGKFDYVLFMGLFYHLRYPLLALDKVVTKVGRQLIFQTMLRGSFQQYSPQPDYDFSETAIFSDPDFPATYFIQKSYSNDYTNWFIPNRSAAEGILASAGLNIISHPEPETWICVPTSAQRDGRYILEMELDGTI